MRVSSRRRFGLITAAAAAILCLLALPPVKLRAFVISGGSMEDTLRIGERLLATGLHGTPSRGELVLLHPPTNRSQTFLKRVVAVGGDRLHFRDKVLYVNGSAVLEPYAVHKMPDSDPFRDNFPSEPNRVTIGEEWAAVVRAAAARGDLIVPAGKFFVLGDNRDNSLDSRYWGFLEAADMIGKPLVAYSPAIRKLD